MRQLTLLLFAVSTISCFGQNKDTVDSYTTIFVTEPMPSYPGGYVEMEKFLKKNLKYPKTDKAIKGKVFVEFNVNEDGTLTDFKVLKGLGEPFDEIALETLKKMPNWTPAKRDNKTLRTKMVMPITFDK